MIKRLKNKIQQNDRALELANEIRVLPDKKIGTKKYSLIEFENLDRKYILKKQKKNLGDIFIILDGRFEFPTKKDKKHSIKSPTKLLIKLYHIEGGENGIDYILKNYWKQLNIEAIISILDSPKIVENYISIAKKDINLDKLLILACEKEKLETVKKLINLGGNIDAVSNENLNLLMIAIQNNDLNMVKLLIDKGIDKEFSYKNKEKFEITPLTMSIMNNNDEIFDFLLEKKVDIDNKFPLFYAILSENIRATKRLITKGAKLEAEDRERRPLMLALARKNYELTRLLVDGGASLEKMSEKEIMTPMEIIISSENIRGMELFLEKGYKLSEKELKKLSRKEKFELTKLILENKLGYNYIEKIEEQMKGIKLDINWKKSMKINGVIKIKYDFEKYKKGVKGNG